MTNTEGGVREVAVVLEVAPVDPAAAAQRHIDVMLTRTDALTLRAVRDCAAGRLLKSGRYVQTGPDVLRFILEKIREAIEAAEAGAERKAAGKAASPGGTKSRGGTRTRKPRGTATQ